jgi:hypothetical protein
MAYQKEKARLQIRVSHSTRPFLGNFIPVSNVPYLQMVLKKEELKCQNKKAPLVTSMFSFCLGHICLHEAIR